MSQQVQMMGHRIRRLRRKNKLTQPAFAKRLGIPVSDLSRIERDELRVSLDTLIRILTEFDVGRDELLGTGSSGQSGRRPRRG